MGTIKNTRGKRCVPSQSLAEGIEIYSGMSHVQAPHDTLKASQGA